MPTFENYVRLIAGPDTLTYFKSRYFSPYILYPPPIGYDKTEWAQTEYGTTYMSGHAATPIELTDNDGSLVAKFQSREGPPVPFYRHLVARFPFLVIQYEFCCEEIGKCGYGRLSTINQSEPQTYTFSSVDEICTIREWMLTK
jgi:hypothetical protein